jgi:flagellar biosynthesis protein FlhB
MNLLRNAGWTLCLVLVLAAAVDLPLQWFRLRNSLRMSHRDVSDEQKETEGDPRIKGRIRSLQMQMRRKQMMSAVPRADVIITNPSHYAVAIRYNEHESGAPLVIAKGVDHLATRIREIAQGCDIPFVEAPPLARALYRHVEVDQHIPAALYHAVAQVLAYVYQLRQWRGGQGRAPTMPAQIAVPAGLDPHEASQ